MALKQYRPTSPSRRGMSGYGFEEITRSKPEKLLLSPLRKKAGRNNQGRVTVRHRGGGHKKMLRVLDFKRDKQSIPGKVAAIEYAPDRSARVALIHYADGEKRYILAPVGLRVGDTVSCGPDAELKPGNCLPVRAIPSGTLIHSIELVPGGGGQIARTAGAAAQLLSIEGDYALLRLPSGEMRRVHKECYAVVGQVGNIDHQNIVLGKAGRRRWMGWRPAVRGAAMSPRDHPHGGGEGRNPRGMHPKTPWGKPALGYRTRKRKVSDKMIVARRP